MEEEDFLQGSNVSSVKVDRRKIAIGNMTTGKNTTQFEDPPPSQTREVSTKEFLCTA